MDGLSLPLRVSPGVRHTVIDDLRVLLDLDRTSYQVLDHVASAMWSIFVGERPRSAVLAELAGTYDAPLAVLERDLERFGARCVAEGLLLTPAEPAAVARRDPDGGIAASDRDAGVPRRVGRPRWYWPEAVYSLVSTSRRIARDGLRPVYDDYAGVPVGPRRIAFARALATFLAAENVYVSSRAPDDCLARSLALYRFLRRAGFAAVHVIGVRRIPFRAHAWVEYEGEIVLDKPLSGYVPLARLDRGA